MVPSVRPPVRILIPVSIGSFIAAILLGLAALGESAHDTPRILLSRQLMRESSLHVGDDVTLAADSRGARATTFRVAGVYEPVPDPRKFPRPRLEARLHLPDLIALTADPGDPLAEESVGAFNLALADPQDAEAVRSLISTRVPGLIVESTAKIPRDDPFAVLDRFQRAIAIVTVCATCLRFLLQAHEPYNGFLPRAVG